MSLGMIFSVISTVWVVFLKITKPFLWVYAFLKPIIAVIGHLSLMTSRSLLIALRSMRSAIIVGCVAFARFYAAVTRVSFLIIAFGGYVHHTVLVMWTGYLNGASLVALFFGGCINVFVAKWKYGVFYRSLYGIKDNSTVIGRFVATWSVIADYIIGANILFEWIKYYVRFFGLDQPFALPCVNPIRRPFEHEEEAEGPSPDRWNFDCGIAFVVEDDDEVVEFTPAALRSVIPLGRLLESRGCSRITCGKYDGCSDFLDGTFFVQLRFCDTQFFGAVDNHLGMMPLGDWAFPADVFYQNGAVVYVVPFQRFEFETASGSVPDNLGLSTVICSCIDSMSDNPHLETVVKVFGVGLNLYRSRGDPASVVGLLMAAFPKQTISLFSKIDPRKLFSTDNEYTTASGGVDGLMAGLRKEFITRLMLDTIVTEMVGHKSFYKKHIARHVANTDGGIVNFVEGLIVSMIRVYAHVKFMLDGDRDAYMRVLDKEGAAVYRYNLIVDNFNAAGPNAELIRTIKAEIDMHDRLLLSVKGFNAGSLNANLSDLRNKLRACEAHVARGKLPLGIQISSKKSRPGKSQLAEDIIGILAASKKKMISEVRVARPVPGDQYMTAFHPETELVIYNDALMGANDALREPIVTGMMGVGSGQSMTLTQADLVRKGEIMRPVDIVIFTNNCENMIPEDGHCINNPQAFMERFQVGIYAHWDSDPQNDPKRTRVRFDIGSYSSKIFEMLKRKPYDFTSRPWAGTGLTHDEVLKRIEMAYDEHLEGNRLYMEAFQAGQRQCVQCFRLQRLCHNIDHCCDPPAEPLDSLDVGALGVAAIRHSRHDALRHLDDVYDIGLDAPPAHNSGYYDPDIDSYDFEDTDDDDYDYWMSEPVPDPTSRSDGTGYWDSQVYTRWDLNERYQMRRACSDYWERDYDDFSLAYSVWRDARCDELVDIPRDVMYGRDSPIDISLESLSDSGSDHSAAAARRFNTWYAQQAFESEGSDFEPASAEAAMAVNVALMSGPTETLVFISLLMYVGYYVLYLASIVSGWFWLTGLRDTAHARLLSVWHLMSSQQRAFMPRIGELREKMPFGKLTYDEVKRILWLRRNYIGVFAGAFAVMGIVITGYFAWRSRFFSSSGAGDLDGDVISEENLLPAERNLTQIVVDDGSVSAFAYDSKSAITVAHFITKPIEKPFSVWSHENKQAIIYPEMVEMDRDRDYMVITSKLPLKFGGPVPFKAFKDRDSTKALYLSARDSAGHIRRMSISVATVGTHDITYRDQSNPDTFNTFVAKAGEYVLTPYVPKGSCGGILFDSEGVYGRIVASSLLSNVGIVRLHDPTHDIASGRIFPGLRTVSVVDAMTARGHNPKSMSSKSMFNWEKVRDNYEYVGTFEDFGTQKPKHKRVEGPDAELFEAISGIPRNSLAEMTGASGIVEGVDHKVSPMEHWINAHVEAQSAPAPILDTDPLTGLREFLDAAVDRMELPFKRPLTVEEAVEGGDGLHPLNSTTSAGFPAGPKRDYMHHNGVRYTFGAGLRRRVSDMYTKVLSGMIPPLFVTPFNKVTEILSVEKVREGRGRIIMNTMGLVYSVVVRMLLLPILLNMVMSRDIFGMLVGIAATRPSDVNDLMQRIRFNEPGSVFVNGDFWKFDVSMRLRIAYLVLGMIMRVAKRMGYTREERRALGAILYNAIFPYFSYRGDVWRSNGNVWPSGHLGTEVFQSLCAWVLHMIVSLIYIRDVMGRDPTVTAMWVMHEERRVQTYGDDNGCRTGSGLPDGVFIADVMGRCGYRMTDNNDKTKAPLPASTLEMLKRSIVVRDIDGQRIPFMPLEIKSIVKSLYLPKKGLDGSYDKEIYKQQLYNANMELFLHGSVEHSRWFEALDAAYVREGGTGHLPSFDELMGRYLADGIITWDGGGQLVELEAVVGM